MHSMDNAKISDALIPWIPPLDVKVLAEQWRSDQGRFDGKLVVDVSRRNNISGEESPTSPVHYRSDRENSDDPLHQKKVSFYFPGEATAEALEPLKGSQGERWLAEHSSAFIARSNLLKSSIKALPKNDPERSQKIAALYYEAYSREKDFVQQLLLSVQADPALQNTDVAKFLAGATIKTMEMASKSVAKELLKPIVTKQRLYDPKAIEVPVSYVSWDAELDVENMEAILAINIANNSMKDLQERRDILNPKKTPLDQIATALLQSQKEGIHRTLDITSQQRGIIRKQLESFEDDPNIDPDIVVSSRLEQKRLGKFHKECLAQRDKISGSQPISDLAQAKEILVHEILTMIHPALEAAESLQRMLVSRKIN